VWWRRLGEGPILVGASMGGGVSLIAIGESHLAASALVLVDMAPRIEPKAGVASRNLWRKNRGIRLPAEVADAIANYQPLAPDLARWMASPKMSASAPMASITGTGTPARRRMQGDQTTHRSDCTPAPTICTCRRSLVRVASPTC